MFGGTHEKAEEENVPRAFLEGEAENLVKEREVEDKVYGCK